MLKNEYLGGIKFLLKNLMTNGCKDFFPYHHKFCFQKKTSEARFIHLFIKKCIKNYLSN